jgi:ABC-type uncharacterized transport system permease subunit
MQMSERWTVNPIGMVIGSILGGLLWAVIVAVLR